jgi:flagellar hook-associated protein 3 FlgL
VSAGRITEGMLGRRLLSDLQASTQRIGAAQRQIASGKRIERPSDDPLATHSALRLRNELSALAADQSSISDARGWLDTTEAALASITDVVQRARESVVKAGNGTLTQGDRNKIADEIDQLIETVKGAANSSYGGRYVLSGTETDQAAYLAGADDTWQGDIGGAVYRQIGPGVSITVNVRGDDILGNGLDAGGVSDGKLLGTLRQVSANLRSGNLAGLRGDDLVDLSRNLEDVSAARGVIGALSNRIESASSRLAQLEEATLGLLSEAEDTDIAKALIELSTQQSVYQGALKSGQALIQPSLLDFLR